MKRLLIYVLVLLMAFSGVPVHGEEWIDDSELEIDLDVDSDLDDLDGEDPEEEPEQIEIDYDYDVLTVGTPTPFSGNFFARMWGNLTSDLDVQMLVHGYNLVEWDSEEGAFMLDPSVVSGIVVTENEEGDRTYTLMLYDDLLYSDGTPITAWDYAFSILLSIAPEIAQIGGNPVDMEYIVGYGPYVTGQAAQLSGVRVIGDLMMSITVSHEYLPFFYELGLLNCTPTPISVVAPGCRVADDGQGVYIANINPAAAPAFTAAVLQETILNETTGYLSHPAVSSGPYRLVSFDGERVELEINENYKGNNEGITPTIPRLVYSVVDKAEMLDQFVNGDVMLLNKVLDADNVQNGLALVAQNNNTFAMTNYPRTGLGFITFCCEKPTVSSQAVRQAISYTFDKDSVTGDTVSNFGLRVDGYYGLGQWMFQLLSGTIAYPVKEPELGASQQEMQKYEDELKKWEDLNLDEVPLYDPNVEEAIRLLEADGWTLNRQGQPFTAGADDVRCKLIDGAIVALDLTMLCPEENGMAEELAAAFVGAEEAGIRVTVKNLPMKDVLLRYYREMDRDCDLIFMASNFDVVFDPSVTFMPDRFMQDGEEMNPYNFSAVDDEALYALAVDLRQTEPEDVLGYCEKWVAFQEHLQDVCPIISIYSSVYFDFYPRVLQDYDVSSAVAWSQAVVYAFLGDVPELEEEEPGEETPGDDEIVFDF